MIVRVVAAGNPRRLNNQAGSTRKAIRLADCKSSAVEKFGEGGMGSDVAAAGKTPSPAICSGVAGDRFQPARDAPSAEMRTIALQLRGRSTRSTTPSMTVKA